MRAISARPSDRIVTRRRVLATAGLLPAAGMEMPDTRAASALAWTNYVSPSSGASINYPTTWAVNAEEVTALEYPRQSFAVRSGPQPSNFVEIYPDLSSYPRDSIFLWLLHYDDHQDLTDCPFLQGRRIRSYAQLTQRMSEFYGFRRYGMGFSGAQRSFILCLWAGVSAAPGALALLNQCLSSLSVP